MGLKSLYDAKPVAIHILGKPAEGDLKRPFKAGGMFGGTLRLARLSCWVRWMSGCCTGSSDPQTDKAAIDEAEKKIGKKDE